MPELVFDRVGRSFAGCDALSAISLEVPDGSFTAIVGPSGCGKSTLLELAGGLQPPTTGRVLLDGVPVVGPDPRTAVIFQAHNLFDWLTVADNVAFGLRSRGAGRREARRIAERQLERVGLGAASGRVPAELSGGMRQRVALARALVLDAELLLMDEPFASLDLQTRRLMQRHLTATWARSGMTAVLVTHDLEEALVLADRIVLLSGSPGRVVEVVDLDDDAPRPRDPADPALAELRSRLEAHLEREVGAGEFTDEELRELLGAGSR